VKDLTDKRQSAPMKGWQSLVRYKMSQNRVHTHTRQLRGHYLNEALALELALT